MKAFIAAWSEFVIEKRILVLVLSMIALMIAVFPIYKTIEYQGLKAEQESRESNDQYEGNSNLEENFDERWLYFDNSNEMWFLANDPALLRFDLLKERFGDNEYLLVGIEAREQDKDLFNKETLEMIHKLTEFLEDHEFVTKVASLSKYQYIHSADDALVTDDLIEDVEELDERPETYQRMANIMSGEALVHGFLITGDLQHTLISARILHIKNSSDHLVKIVQETRNFIKENKFEAQGFQFRLMGNPLITEQFLSYTEKDNSTTLPLMLVLILVFMFISFRTIAGTLLPFVVIIGSILSVVGALGYLGFAFNVLNIGIITLLVAVGVGDAVHIITDFYQMRAKGRVPKEAAKEAIQILWIPCFNTSFTTAAGFLSISISNLKPLQEYGYIAAIGVFIAFLISVTTLPALLSFVKGGSRTPKRISEHGYVAKITANLTPFTYKYRKSISLFSFILMGMSFLIAAQLKVDANFVNYFKEGSPMRTDIVYFDKNYGGGINLELMIDSGKEDGVKDLDFLKEALAFQEYLESLKEMGKANSILNYIRKMNQSLHNDDPSEYRIPEDQGEATRGLVAQYLLLYENGSPEEDLTDLKTGDYRYMRLSIRVHNMSTAKLKILIDQVMEYQRKNFPKLKVEETGNMILFNNMDTYIQQGLVRSFSLAIGIIILCFFALLRSIKYGFLSLIPSIFPILFAGGVMHVMGNTLDFGTMIIAAVTFGIAVDDTIHMMSRYAKNRRTGHERKQAMHLSLTESGRAIVFTSIILYCGFTVLMLSSFVPNIYFGLFGGIIILVALLADLIILPAVIFYFGDFRKKPTGANSDAA
ncbi:MAG: MMPL family transporter [SAR324 cluster bacterium]|nr:MMPL family transporter [SAR324 cluster bacterium]